MSAVGWIPVVSSVAVGLLTAAMVLFRAERERERAAVAALGHERRAPEGAILLRAFHPAVRTLVPLSRWLGSEGYRERVEIALVRAGLARTLSVQEMLAFKTVTALVLAGGVIAALDGELSLRVGVAAVAGFVVPDFWLKSRVARRQREIAAEFPFCVDLLSLCVEATLDVESSLRRVAARCASASLRSELDQILAEITFGSTRRSAFRNFARRVDLPAIHTFVASVVQGEELGTPIAALLKDLARTMRADAAARAEHAGARAGQFVMAVMVFVLVPASMAVLLGPAVVSLVESGVF